MSDGERLEQLALMDSEVLRAMAASMPVIEQAKGIVMACYGRGRRHCVRGSQTGVLVEQPGSESQP